MALNRACFITLEGGEGAGKSTQAEILKGRLAKLEIGAVVTREPGGSRRAEVIRELLLCGDIEPFGPQAEALFFAVARMDHMRETIRPALDSGTWVICDRFIDSTRAYQGANGVEPEELNRLERLSLGQLRPDLTFILDLPAVVGIYRAKSRSEPVDRFEAEDIAVQEMRRKIFLDIAEIEPQRCVVIDASRKVEDVASAIYEILTERLGQFMPKPAGN